MLHCPLFAYQHYARAQRAVTCDHLLIVRHSTCFAVATQQSERCCIGELVLLLELLDNFQRMAMHKLVLGREDGCIKLLGAVGSEIEAECIVMKAIVEQVHTLLVALILT